MDRPATLDPIDHALRAHRLDLLWVGALTVTTYVLASRLELFERFGANAARFERWQLDELVFTMLSLAAGLAWYAWRRARESAAALQRSRDWESRTAQLLAHNRVLAQQVLTAQERERLELARELHDEMGQCCNAISVEAAVIAQCDAPDAGVAKAGAQRIDALARDLYARVHALLRKLRPTDLDALGLGAALDALCAAWQQRSGVTVQWHAGEGCESLGPACQIAVYRVAQEALSNVVRHARAHTTALVLQRLATGDVRLEVRDDGVGFDPSAARSGFGLLGATERAAALGGALSVSSRPGAGTVLTLNLPGSATAE